MIGLGAGNLGKALELIELACALDEERAEYQAQAARCLALLRHEARARMRAERALALPLDDAPTLDVLGVVFTLLGSHERAVELFERAAAGAPANAGIQYNLASSLRICGRLDAAEAAYENALRLDAGLYRAHSALADLRTQTAEHNHIVRLLEQLGRVGDDAVAELHLRHALAKEYEDLGEYARAFEHLAAGKSRRRAGLDYSSERDRALFARIESAFTPEVFADPPPGHDSDEPLFVIGMPRTGTTLVERILSSHSAVASAGELQNFGVCLKRAAGTRSARILDEETVAAGLGTDFAALGRQYVDSTRPLTGHTPHFVDKLPINFFYAGFIQLALPRAKIVCLRRGAMDTGLSNFRQLFAAEFPYYDYANDLRDIGRYVVMFDRLIAHWRRVLPGKLLEVRYESLVTDPEPETRRILEHCGLDPDPACLAFERNAAPVATASAVQVRRPLYSTSVGRWRRYEKELGPLRRELEAAGIALESG